MGDYATKCILNEKYKKYSDVVGKAFDLSSDIKIIPIFEKIFKEIKVV